MHFKHGGRRYSLRKRSPERDAPWYLVGVVAGKRMQRSLDTNVADIARQRAISGIIEPAGSGRWQVVQETKLKRHFATVTELLAAWTGLSLGAGGAHKRQAANQFLQVLRLAGVANAAGASAGVLDESLARRYFEAVQREAEAEEDQEAGARRKRTGLRTWDQAKCVLQPAARVAYRQKDIAVNLPDVLPMLDYGAMLHKKLKAGTDFCETPPDFELMDRLVAAWPALPWNQFAAVGMALAFGLRAGEWDDAEWGWFKVKGGKWVADGRTKVKNKTGRLEVEALNPWWHTFRARAVAEGRWGAGFVLEGTDGQRREGTERAVSAWMRGLGWAGQKTNHAFRAYAGAQVVLKWGLPRAKSWLRHRSSVTTERNYTGAWVDQNKERVTVVDWARAEG